MIFSENQLERYSRHFVLPEIGVSGQKKLLKSKVLVIGAGALGSAALVYLACAGVGTIGIADYDNVELSNLQRQIVHKTGAVGTDKASSAKNTVNEINPDIKVLTYQKKITAHNIQDIIKDYDFIIDGTDRFETKFLINDACVLMKKPYSHAGVVGFRGQVMTYVPNKGPCLRCLLEKIPPNTITCSQAGVLGSVTGIIGSIQSLEAIKYLLDIGDLLTGRILCFDGLKLSVHITKTAKSFVDCSICGENPTILNLLDNKEEYEYNICC